MLVSAGNLTHHGKLLGAGDPITDPENWRKVLPIYLANGQVLDVSPEVAAQMREGQIKKERHAIGQRAAKKFTRARALSEQTAGMVQSLTSELADAEQAMRVAEAAEFEAAEELKKLRDEYGDEALGFAPESQDEPAQNETGEDSSADDPPAANVETAPSPLTADALRAKAIATVGGFTKGMLVAKVEQWWGVNIYDLEGADGTRLYPRGITKPVVLDVAIAMFEARYRLEESAKLTGADAPSDAELLSAMLCAVGVAVVQPETSESDTPEGEAD